MLHWLIVVPYYFFGTLALAVVLDLATRLLRLPVSDERLAAVAVFTSIAVLAALLGTDLVDLEDLTLPPLLALAGASFVLAGADALVAPAAPAEADSRVRAAGEPRVF